MLLLVFGYKIKRWLCYINVSLLDKLSHVAIEECQQQYSYVASVYIGIGHTYDFVVSELFDVKLSAYSRTERRYHRTNFLVSECSVKSCLFNIENFTSQRKYGLITSASAALCSTACGKSLDYKYLALRRILFGAIGKLTRESRAVKLAFASCKIPCVARRLSRPCRRDYF